MTKLRSMSYTEPRHPINFVCRRTGLSVHLIRAWERRYKAVVPKRTDTNRRMYSDENVDKLKLLKRLVDGGHSIGNIAALDASELEAILGNETPDPAQNVSPFKRSENEDVAELLRRCQEAIHSFSASDLCNTLAEAQITLPRFAVVTEIIGPLMYWVGEEWHASNLRVAQEHLASAVVRDILSDIRRAAREIPGAPAIVVTTPAGDMHEIGAMMVAAAASIDGWRDIYLGGDLPAEEIAGAVRKSGARAVALSVALPGSAPELLRELERIRTFVSEGVPIFVGGAGATAQRHHLEEAGLQYVATLDEFRVALRASRAEWNEPDAPTDPAS